MNYQLCNTCPEKPYCGTTCLDALETIPFNPKDRMKDKEYKPKGIPLLSYAESRLTKHNDLKELNFN